MAGREFDLVNAVAVGVDGAKGGWVAVAADGEGRLHIRRFEAFRAVLRAFGPLAIVAVDMPIGLLAAAREGGRDCDRAARNLLGRRASCVFSPPVRACLGATDYARAVAINRASAAAGIGLSWQAFGLFPLLRDLDREMTPGLQARVLEAHPELAFREMKGSPLDTSKRTVEGRKERRTLLVHRGFGEVARESMRPSKVAVDDLLDACALCWTALRIRAGWAHRLPADPPLDERGLRMEIWF